MFNFLLTFGSTACDTEKAQKFLGLIPKWYQYLPYTLNNVTGRCEVQFVIGNGANRFNAFWLIALAILDILLRVAGLVAVAFVIYGGIRYILSQGEPQNTKDAQNTIVNALIGIVIVVLASAVVSFIGKSLG